MESGYKILEQILLGGTLQDKLSGLDRGWSEWEWSDQKSAFTDVLECPGRLGKLKPIAASESRFPKKSELKLASGRGRLIHFFANHELLALETMAYALLKFPNADESFRQGVFRTLQDEQKHLKKYLDRMQECGVTLGEVPLNLYFWNTLKHMKSPLDYVTQMSLTFEQANLDFALEYAKFFEEEVDDLKTAVMLREVHDDEVKHVAHGVKWFEKWKDPEQSSFEAYQKQLPFPMTPRRAKGSKLFSAESRREAGMSEAFIESIRVSGGSRGRVPHYYYFNPQCEVEHEFQELPQGLKSKIQDLKPLMIWLASEDDVVELDSRPSLSWLKAMHAIKGELPEFIISEEDLNRYQAFEELRPWGFGESAWKKFDSLKNKVRKKPLYTQGLHREKLFSKTYWKDFLKTEGSVIRNKEDLESWFKNSGHSDFLVKSDQSTSGRGHLRIPRSQKEDPAILKKFSHRLSKGESFVIEPYLDKVQDFSVQYEIRSDGSVLPFEPRFFYVDDHFQYQGALLGRPHFSIESKYGKAWIQVQKEKPEWSKIHERVISHLKEYGYIGPVGIDAMVYQDDSGEYRVQPVIEVNVRYTMGRIAIEVEKSAIQSKSFKSGVLRFLNKSDLSPFFASSFVDLESKLQQEFRNHILSTTPAASAGQTWTFAIFADSTEIQALVDRFLKTC